LCLWSPFSFLLLLLLSLLITSMGLSLFSILISSKSRFWSLSFSKTSWSALQKSSSSFSANYVFSWNKSQRSFFLVGPIWNMLFNSFISDIPLGMWDLLKKKTIAKYTTHLAIVIINQWLFYGTR
jgi:hypothetical protein